MFHVGWFTQLLTNRPVFHGNTPGLSISLFSKALREEHKRNSSLSAHHTLNSGLTKHHACEQMKIFIFPQKPSPQGPKTTSWFCLGPSPPLDRKDPQAQLTEVWRLITKFLLNLGIPQSVSSNVQTSGNVAGSTTEKQIIP